jgi:hypothetical protein
MAMHHSVRSLVCALSAAGLLVLGTASASATAQDAAPACGDDKGGKDTKKPKPDDEKRPINPASFDQLCGGDKGKDTKKPKPDEDQDKRPPNPA